MTCFGGFGFGFGCAVICYLQNNLTVYSQILESTALLLFWCDPVSYLGGAPAAAFSRPQLLVLRECFLPVGSGQPPLTEVLPSDWH